MMYGVIVRVGWGEVIVLRTTSRPYADMVCRGYRQVGTARADKRRARVVELGRIL